MGTVNRVFDGWEPNWPATDDNPSCDLPRYQVAHGDYTGQWPGAPTAAGVWFVSSTGQPTVQEIIDYLDPPAIRAERLRQIAIRADTRRSALLNTLKTGDNDDIAAVADAVTDLADAKELLAAVMLVVALDTRT